MSFHLQDKPQKRQRNQYIYMSSSLSHHFTGIGSGLLPSIPGISPSKYNPPNLLACFWTTEYKDKSVNSCVRPMCNVISKSFTQEYYKDVNDDTGEDMEGNYKEVRLSNGIKERVDTIRSVLSTLRDGISSPSAYDIAWVSLIKDVNGSNTPQFPNTLQWIVNNQLPDGSWGLGCIFSLHDRLVNTLACVIALKSWNLHPEKHEEGMKFIWENISKLEEENEEHMSIGFEICFPMLVDMAKKMEIDVPDSPFLQEIYAKRNLKLKKIPKDILHSKPTTLNHSMEGMEGLDWEKLLKLANLDGSFVSSPACTAYAYMQTKDENCLSFLNRVVETFDGGVPNGYPMDLFEHMWAVDRLQRLGISRYFKTEIKECINYVYRYWNEEGMSWGRNQRVNDIDDTAMGFRLLRLHGYDVSPNLLRNFEKDGEFFCFPGQTSESVTAMYNVYRATHLMFPGETVLEEANKFSSKFLRDRRASNQLFDKWIITKDLPGEVEFGMNVPWYASLPRVEARFYMEHYGGGDDVWIGKTYYKMPNVCNNNYLELAKLDFNHCQALHQFEWDTLQEWYTNCNLGDFGVNQKKLLFSYFLAAASIYEPKRSEERLGWAKTTVLIEAVASYFDNESTSLEKRNAFINEFMSNNSTTRDYLINGRMSSSDPNKTSQGGLIGILLETLNRLSLDVLVTHDKDIRHHLCSAWGKWLQTLHEKGDRYQGEAELLVHTIKHCGGGQLISEDLLLTHSRFQRLSQLTNRVCRQLRHFQKHTVHSNGSYNNTTKDSMTTPQIELGMQELAQFVLPSSPEDIDADIDFKQTFLTVAKSFYYTAYCDPKMISFHIAKVLFERVE